METCKICGLTMDKINCSEEANCLNIPLEAERKYLSNWNKRRADNEKIGLEKFYKLKETFKKQIT